MAGIAMFVWSLRQFVTWWLLVWGNGWCCNIWWSLVWEISWPLACGIWRKIFCKSGRQVQMTLSSCVSVKIGSRRVLLFFVDLVICTWLRHVLYMWGHVLNLNRLLNFSFFPGRVSSLLTLTYWVQVIVGMLRHFGPVLVIFGVTWRGVCSSSLRLMNWCKARSSLVCEWSVAEVLNYRIFGAGIVESLSRALLSFETFWTRAGNYCVMYYMTSFSPEFIRVCLQGMLMRLIVYGFGLFSWEVVKVIRNNLAWFVSFGNRRGISFLDGWVHFVTASFVGEGELNKVYFMFSLLGLGLPVKVQVRLWDSNCSDAAFREVFSLFLTRMVFWWSSVFPGTLKPCGFIHLGGNRGEGNCPWGQLVYRRVRIRSMIFSYGDKNVI